jgi:hypothetical protein
MTAVTRIRLRGYLFGCTFFNGNEFWNGPNVVCQSGFHRGRQPQRLVHTAEVIVDMVDSHMAVILELL